VSKKVVTVVGMSTEPKHHIDLKNGEQLYQQNCSQCHGLTGQGDGPSSGNFNPPPTSFLDSKLSGYSPFHFFNVIKLGVPGTAMAAFDYLADDEIWNLASYVISIQKRESGVLVQSDHFALMTAQSKLNQSLKFYEEEKYSLARDEAISAYLEGIEPIEPKLRLKNNSLALQIESSLRKIRKQIENKESLAELQKEAALFFSDLKKADELLTKKESSLWFTYSVSLGIFLREALEAALLLIALLGVVHKFGSRKAVFAVHFGWAFALLLGVMAWFLSSWLLMISGAQRELLEGGMSLFAVLLLMCFGLWMHRKSEIGRWRDFIKQMVGVATERKSVLALGSVAFLGVFREVFETVVFLRALLVESGNNHQIVLGLGVLTGLLIVVALSWWSVKWSAKIPVRELFIVSSWIMFFLSFILLGKGIYALQEMGLIPITDVGLNFQIDLLGLYPFYQTLIPQLLLIIFIVLYQAWEKANTWRLSQKMRLEK
jgi:high-affinity iron transporter